MLRRHALIKIVTEHDLGPEQIERIVHHVHPSRAKVIDGNPLKSHCSQYIMAVTAVLRRVPPDAIVHDYRRSDARIGAMAGRTSLVGDVAEPGFGFGSVVVELTTRDGRTLTEKLSHWRGHQNDPLTRPELEEKFLRLATMRLSRASAERVMQLCDDLENLTDAAELAELLSVPEASAR